MSKALTPTQRRAFHKPIKKKQPKRPSAADAEREDALEFDRKMAEMREHVRARLSNSEQSA